MHEAIKLLGSTKSKITKDKNSKNVPFSKLLKWYQYILILLTTIIKKIKESAIHLFHIHLYIYKLYTFS